MRVHSLENDKLAQTPSLPPAFNVLVGGGRNKQLGRWKAFHSFVLSPAEALTTPACSSLLCLQASLSHLYVSCLHGGKNL